MSRMPKATTRLIITLLLINLFSSFIGTSLAVYAGLGFVTCILVYVASGMIGIASFVLFMTVRCKLGTAGQSSQGLPQLNSN